MLRSMTLAQRLAGMETVFVEDTVERNEDPAEVHSSFDRSLDSIQPSHTRFHNKHRDLRNCNHRNIRILLRHNMTNPFRWHCRRPLDGRLADTHQKLGSIAALPILRTQMVVAQPLVN